MNSYLIILLITLAFASAYPIRLGTRAAKIDLAYQTLDSDYKTLRDLYSDDAVLKFCWGGENAGCKEGGVDEILYPYHKLIKTFRVKIDVITGEDAEVVSTNWYNHMETPDGCGQVTTGIAVFEFDDDDKVVKHYSLSDDETRCVNNYIASLEQKEFVN